VIRAKTEGGLIEVSYELELRETTVRYFDLGSGSQWFKFSLSDFEF